MKLVEDYAKDNHPVVFSLFEKYSNVNKFVFESRLEASEWMGGIV